MKKKIQNKCRLHVNEPREKLWERILRELREILIERGSAKTYAHSL